MSLRRAPECQAGKQVGGLILPRPLLHAAKCHLKALLCFGTKVTPYTARTTPSSTHSAAPSPSPPPLSAIHVSGTMVEVLRSFADGSEAAFRALNVTIGDMTVSNGAVRGVDASTCVVARSQTLVALREMLAGEWCTFIPGLRVT